MATHGIIITSVGPRSGLNIDPRSSRGVRPAPLFALILSLTAKGAVLEAPRGFRGGLRRNRVEDMLGGCVYHPVPTCNSRVSCRASLLRA
eukprot:14520158-Alexandrium_andersonii.AAC.1